MFRLLNRVIIVYVYRFAKRRHKEVSGMNFTGLEGATALSAIAFGVVFLVLIGLTCVIYAMRFVSKGRN